MPRSSLKCFICVVLSVVALWLMSMSGLSAQTTEGTEFWLVFQKNFLDSVADDRTDELRPAEPLKLSVTVTARRDAKGYLECPSLGLSYPFEVEGGKTVTIRVDPGLQLVSDGVVEKKSLHVVADRPVSVYAASHRYQTTDTYLAFPVDALGLAYRAVGYKWLSDDLLSQFAVAATEDNTTVTITPSIRTSGGEPAGTPYRVTLNRGDVYQVRPAFDPTREDDLTGSLITADKPVAVFSGHNCAYVPERSWKACNLLAEQLPPVDTWGKEFVVGNFAGRSSSVIRVVAHHDGTVVYENGREVAALNAGQFYENPMVTEPVLVRGTEPVLVMQYAKGFTAPTQAWEGVDSLGDPMMILIPPADQYLNSYNFAAPFTGSWEHFITLTATTEGTKGIRLDGERVAAANFTPIPGTDYHVAKVQVKQGAHLVEGKVAFGLYSYGFGFADKIFDAYGNNCGQGLTRWVAERPQDPAMSQSQNAEKKDDAARSRQQAVEIVPPPETPSSPVSKEIRSDRPEIESRKRDQ